MSNISMKEVEPAVFNDRVENYDIIQTIKDIQSKHNLHTQDELKNMYPEFSTDNPELFTKCCRNQMTKSDIEKMKYMLDLRLRVKEGKLSFHEASQMISVYMAKIYQPELLTKNGFNKKK